MNSENYYSNAIARRSFGDILKHIGGTALKPSLVSKITDTFRKVYTVYTFVISIVNQSGGGRLANKSAESKTSFNQRIRCSMIGLKGCGR
jgi:hypothetical protein